MESKKQTILEWYQKKQKDIYAPCGGLGNCGRCKVRFLENPPKPTVQERLLLSEEELAQKIRLACQTEWQEKSRFEPLFEWSEEQKQHTASEEKFAKEAGRQETASYGMVIDIGTTTLVMQLIDLISQKELAEIAKPNPQRIYGADVISRIRMANEGSLGILQGLIQQAIEKLMAELLSAAQICANQVKKAVVVGNTAMLHLLLGYSCEGLGKAPFAPADLSMQKKKGSDVFRKLSKDAEVVIFPGISAFVGADVVAGMYFCDMDLTEDTQMLVDVGTNGEMAVGNQSGFVVTSAAAGPVFEGGAISCGMPAAGGGITHLKRIAGDGFKTAGQQSDKWFYECLNNKQPCGICGSGLIDLAAGLYCAGIIDENGTLCEEYFEDGYRVQLQEFQTPLAKKEFRILQSDIRELQMGKAAIRAGMELLCQKNMPQKIYLAGAFGTHTDLSAAVETGLFSQYQAEKMKPVGNAALQGAKKFLFDAAGEERVQKIAALAEDIPLANEAAFEAYYIKFMQF